jgi:isocitrate/isopropylmalate dehydrogenase
MRTYRIAVIQGDGIGPELVDAALALLERLAQRESIAIDVHLIDAGASTYRRTGAAMSRESIEAVRERDALLKGPVGLPDVRHSDGTEAGLLGGILRTTFDLYANVRPILYMTNVAAPLIIPDCGIDYVIVRENTEGMYASRGKGVGNRWAVADTMMITRSGSERVARYALELALKRSGAPIDGVRRVTCVDKANVLRSMYLFREVFLEVADRYTDVEAECMYVDAAAQALVMQPEHFDVIVTENLMGDILSDLGGATVGGISMSPSANIGDKTAYFEPVHGSAPALAGKGRANPVGQILSAAMMLEHLGEPRAAGRIRSAVLGVLSSGEVRITSGGMVEGGAKVAAARIADRI